MVPQYVGTLSGDALFYYREEIPVGQASVFVLLPLSKVGVATKLFVYG